MMLVDPLRPNVIFLLAQCFSSYVYVPARASTFSEALSPYLFDFSGFCVGFFA
jgi:hypothetical protein